MNSQILETSESAKLLGVTSDTKLKFSKHIKDTYSRLGGRIYGMRELKGLGLNAEGLKLYYTANIRSVLTYACPVWGSLITDKHQEIFKRVERQALKIMNSDIEYSEAIQIYDLPPVKPFTEQLSRSVMNKIYADTTHPLNNLIKRKTTRHALTQMPICRPEKLQNSFFFRFSDF